MPRFSRMTIIRKLLFVILDFIGFILLSLIAHWLADETSLLFTTHYYSWLGASLALMLLAFYLGGLYSSLWKYAGVSETLRIIFVTVSVNTGMYLLFEYAGIGIDIKAKIIFTLLFMLWAIGIRLSYRVLRSIKMEYQLGDCDGNRVLLVGAGDAGKIILDELRRHQTMGKVVAIIDDDPNKWLQRLQGIQIVGGRELIEQTCSQYKIDQIYVAIPSASTADLALVIDECQKVDCPIKIIPGVYSHFNEPFTLDKLRAIKIEDLLPRESVVHDPQAVASMIEGQTLMVTGGGGSIGSELCRQIAKYSPQKIIVFDIYENGAYDLQSEIRQKYPQMDLRVVIGSVRDYERLDDVIATFKPNTIIHAAAHKHVPLMEASPGEAVKNNVFGTLNVATCAGKNNVEHFVLISTDKAVNPTSIMGATKRLAELIVQNLSTQYDTCYTAVRFGNVLGSHGSVIPLFRYQIEQGGPVTVTHKKMIRYFMTIPEAASLVLQAATLAKTGETFVLDMGEPVKIDHLARRMITLAGLKPDVDIAVKYIGLRPGEKLYEELLVDKEKANKTKHEKIFIEKQAATDLQVSLEQIKALRRWVNSPDRLVREIKQLVPMIDSSTQAAVAADAPS